MEWTTAAEAGTIGFDLLRFDEQAEAWVQVNPRVLTGLFAPQGGTYRLLDTGVSVNDRPTYILVEHDSAGRLSRVGPFAPEIRWDGNANPPEGDFELAPRPTSHRRIGMKSIATSSHGGVKSQQTVRRGGERRAPIEHGRALKIAVRDAGLYRVEGSDIGTHLGISAERTLQLLEDHQFSLTHFGQPIAWRVSDDGAGLEFYGTPVESIYTRENIYRLEPGRGLIMEEEAGSIPAAAVDGGFFRETIHYEEDQQPVVLLPLDPEGDTWFWSYVRADDPDHLATVLELSVHGVSDHATGPVDLAVELQGGSSDEHEVEIWLNGEWVENVQLSQLDQATVTFKGLSPDLLVAGVNRLEVRAISGGVVFIDSVDLGYERAYFAEKGSKLLHRGGDNSTVTIQFFSNPDIRVFDLSDVDRPVELSSVLVGDRGPNGYWAAYEPTSGDIDYFAVTSAGVMAPVALTTDYQSDLRSSTNAADYVIITRRELMTAASGFATMRRNSGLKTLVVDVADIYDEFSDGLTDPNAIRAFLAHAYSRWMGPPSYVLLAGAGTWDYKDNYGIGGNLIPPLMIGTNETIASIFATDAPYADVVGNDGLPEFALGRLPVLTAAEFDAYTAKVADYESGGVASERVLMLADNPDGGGDFSTDSDKLLGLVPPGYDATRIYLSEHDVDDARELLFGKILEGVGLVNYLGHGGIVNFAQEGLLTTDDLPLFSGAPLPPVITHSVATSAILRFPGSIHLASCWSSNQMAGRLR